MQEIVQSLLLTHRENYNVPKGQEQCVHCKVAKMDDNGNFIEKPQLLHFGVKEFETCVKENLETMGSTVEILFHPLGKYSNVVITDKDAEIATRDAEIEALKAKLAEAEAKAKVEEESEQTTEEGGEKKKKGGRPKKED